MKTKIKTNSVSVQCNPGVLFFKIGFWVRFYSNLKHMGLYSRWGSIIQGELNKVVLIVKKVFAVIVSTVTMFSDWPEIMLSRPYNLNLLSFMLKICDNFRKSREPINIKNSRRCSLHGVDFITLEKLAWVGLYSSWGCISSKSVFDWGCITFWMGWGSIQEWGCICVDTVHFAWNRKLKGIKSTR